MMRLKCVLPLAVLCPVLCATFAAEQEPPTAQTRVLADWKAGVPSTLQTSDARVEPAKDGWLVVHAEQGRRRPGVTLRPQQGAWDLSQFAEIAVPARNLTREPVRVVLCVDDDKSSTVSSGKRRGLYEATLPAGGKRAWLTIPLGSDKPQPYADKLFSMSANPPDLCRGGFLNGTRITQVWVFVREPKSEQTIAIGPIVARGAAPSLAGLSSDKAFPFIDEYGQYIHRDWPDKIQSDADFAQRRAAEEAESRAHARPADWNRYGGWAAGPQLKATGFFRVEKIGDWWWMVDPDGRLYWSHGVVRVGTRIRVGTVYHGTPITDRECYFRLPAAGSPFAAFLGTEPQASRGYYMGKEDHAVYDHLEANLFRKYGAAWASQYAQVAQRRLANWGLNSIANSSDPVIYKLRKTPYTAIVYSLPLGRNEHRIEGSTGGWGKLPDAFDPGLRQAMRRTLQTELKDSLQDPLCLGFFADNELNWGDACYLAESTLASPAGQPAKKVFLEDLKRKYTTIDQLNAAWGSRCADWSGLLASTEKPNRKREAVRVDLEAFNRRLLEGYFAACRDSIKEAAPQHLYLGCRFAGAGSAMVMEVAAKYCDVISINRYSPDVADLRLPDGLDRPIVIGEFSFGALDRGMFHAGHQRRVDQAERAQSYCEYVESALKNPAIVGTHWFQYFDQPTTGRFDGENMNFGLLDICDTPHWEMLTACRKMGAALYSIRRQASQAGAQ